MQKIKPPSEDELDDLLFEKLWSKRKVSKHYGVSLPTVSKWMKFYGMTGLTPPKLRAKKAKITMKEKKRCKRLYRLRKKS